MCHGSMNPGQGGLCFAMPRDTVGGMLSWGLSLLLGGKVAVVVGCRPEPISGGEQWEVDCLEARAQASPICSIIPQTSQNTVQRHNY